LKDWSNLARVVYRRTYARKDSGVLENWDQTVERSVMGNVKGKNVPESEIKELIRIGQERKGGPAGRGYWFSGAPSHQKVGGAACCNCWFLTAADWYNFVIALDLLMLGGGVGMSVEHKYTSKLPKVKKGIVIIHKPTKDADFIIPDSREGWGEFFHRILESFFVTGKSFSYSTICLRGRDEAIIGFGGTASGPLPLIEFVKNLCAIFVSREGKNMRPIDAADILTATGQLVVSGNVRRSAILIQGDCWDKEYLKAKRWDLGQIPPHRSNANYSIVCEDIEDLHPLFWKTYEQGEPFGIINIKNAQKYGRMGELKPDAAIGFNPCVPGYTEILTSEGYRRIDSLIGQEVEVWNGIEFSKVRPGITGGNQPLVKVILSSGQSLTCTLYHEFVTAIGYTGATKKVKAKDLAIGTPLAKFDMPIVPGKYNYDFAYTQGFLSAEGMDDYKYFYVYRPKFMCISRLQAEAKEYKESQERATVIPTYQKLKKSFVPDTVWDVDSRLNWFAGLLDGDGTLLKEGGTQVCSVDKTFLLDTQKMLTTLGVNTKVTLANLAGKRLMPNGRGGTRLFDCQDSWRLLVGSQEMQELVSIGLHCERLPLEGFSPQRNAGRFVTVVSVEDSGFAEKVYCFTDPKNGTGCFEGVVTGQCVESQLENGESCNLAEIPLPNVDSEEEFEKIARLMQRYTKRVTMEKYHHKLSDEVIKRNRRTGIGITGCLASPLFNASTLDRVYEAVQDEDRKYSAELGIPLSKRTTLVKPSGTMSKVLDCMGYEGIHAAYSRYMIQRVRFGSSDPLIPKLRAAGHYMEPQNNFGEVNPNTMVVDFYQKAPDGFPVADEDWDTWKQLDVLKFAQKHWSDQAVSVTVYYKREDIPKLKIWLAENLQYIKSISFLCASDHGFVQAPKEAITREQYEKLSKKIKPIDFEDVGEGGLIDGMECEGGACPLR